MPGRVGCARVVGIDGCEYGPPNGVKRFQTGTEATGPAKDAPELELDAFLQVPAAERLTPYSGENPLELMVPRLGLEPRTN